GSIGVDSHRRTRKDGFRGRHRGRREARSPTRTGGAGRPRRGRSRGGGDQGAGDGAEGRHGRRARREAGRGRIVTLSTGPQRLFGGCSVTVRLTRYRAEQTAGAAVRAKSKKPVVSKHNAKRSRD